jgi:tetratricopeptide (TPR) repeat protein
MGTLVPVIGFVQVGSQAMADRYTYVPLIGLFALLSWGWVSMVKKLPHIQPALIAMTGCVLAGLMLVSWFQVDYWRNNKRFFEHMLSVVPDSHLAHNGLGRALAAQGKNDAALKHFSAAVRILPRYGDAHINLADALVALGKVDAAVDHYGIALKINPKDSRAHNNIGIARVKQGKYDEAIRHFSEAIRIDPLDLKFRNNMSVALLRKGKIQQAP